MVFSKAAALDVGIPRESTTSFNRNGHCRSRKSSRISKTLRADFVNSFDMLLDAAPTTRYARKLACRSRKAYNATSKKDPAGRHHDTRYRGTAADARQLRNRRGSH